MSKRSGGIIIGYKDKTSLWHLNGFPDGSSNINWLNSKMSGKKKPNVILYNYGHVFFYHLVTTGWIFYISFEVNM